MDLNSKTSGVTGIVTLVRTNSEGVVLEKISKNLVVDTGKTFIASRMVGAASVVMSHMALGTGAVAATGANTALGTEVGRVALTGSVASTNTVTYTASFGPGVATGAITEAGIFNASTAGTLLARTVFPVVNKAAGDTISTTWVITIS